MKSTPKVLSGILFGVLLLFGGCLTAVYSYFRSPSGIQYLLSKAKDSLSSRGIQLEYQQAKLNPFSSIHFEHLHIVQKTSTSQIDFRAQSFDARYQISFFSRTLSIETLELEKPTLVFHTTHPEESQPSPSSPTSSSFNSSDLSKFILAPPIKIDLQKFVLNQLTLDLDQKGPDGSLKFKTQDALIKLQLQWLPQHFVFAGHYSLPEQSAISYQFIPQTRSQKPFEFRTSLSSSSQWSAEITRENATWKYEIQPSDFQLSLKNLFLSQSSKNSKTQIRWPTIQLTSKAKLLAKTSKLLHLDEKSIESLDSRHLLTTGPFELKDSSSKNPIQFDSQNASLDFNLAQQIEMKLQYGIHHLVSRENLSLPVEIYFQANAEVNRNLKQIKTQGFASIQDIPFFDFDLQGENQDQIKLKGLLGFNLDPKLSNSVRALLNTQKMGRWRIQTDLDTQIDLSHSQELRVKSKGNSTLEQNEVDAKVTPPFTLSKAMVVKHDVDWNPGNLEIGIETLIPELKAPGIPPLSGIQAQLKASLQNHSRFSLKEFNAKIDQTLIQMTAEATGDAKTQSFQTQGTSTLIIPKNFAVTEGQTLSGQIEFPWKLAIYRGKEIQLDGTLNLVKLNWAKSSTRLSPLSLNAKEISGKVPVSEKLVWNGKSVKFAHYLSQNPFERVDFERLQPMIHESEPLRINQVGFEEKTYGPFIGYFSIKQNMIFAHKFEFNLGEGKSDGELFLDAYPKNLQLGLLTRLTGLNLSKILPRKYLPKSSGLDDKISGRSGLVMNLNNGSVDGRIDVTEMGRNQLITLINAMDPSFENEQMNNARFALGFAYPSFIQMSFQQGYMDMGFRLQGALNREFMFRGIPIYSWISGAKAEMIKTSKESKSHE